MDEQVASISSMNGSPRDLVLSTSRAADRSVSPVIGVVLMVVITIVLASVVAVAVMSFEGQLNEPDWGDRHENPWAQDPLLGPEDPRAGAEDVRYRVYLDFEDDTPNEVLNHVNVSVDAEGEDLFSGIETADVETFQIIRDNGSTVELEGVDSLDGSETEVRMSNPGRSFEDFEENDALEIIFGGVDNPVEPGTYDVTVDLTPGGSQEGELEITPATP